MTEPDNQDALYGTAMKMISKLGASQQRTRQLTIGLVVSVMFDLVLSGLLFSIASNQGTATETAHALAISTCRQINVDKANDVKLWDDTLQNNKPVTSTQRQKLDYTRYLVNVRDKQINCAQKYGK